MKRLAVIVVVLASMALSGVVARDDKDKKPKEQGPKGAPPAPPAAPKAAPPSAPPAAPKISPKEAPRPVSRPAAAPRPQQPMPAQRAPQGLPAAPRTMSAPPGRAAPPGRSLPRQIDIPRTPTLSRPRPHQVTLPSTARPTGGNEAWRNFLNRGAEGSRAKVIPSQPRRRGFERTASPQPPSETRPRIRGLEGTTPQALIKDRVRERQGFGNQVRQRTVEEHPHRRDWFNDRFWRHHRHHPSYWRENQNWWGATTWPALAVWLGWSNPVPIYYEENTAIVVSQENINTFYSGEPANLGVLVAPIAAPAESEASQFIPLGTFAVTSTPEPAVEPTMYIQLALNQSGDISGSYYNIATDKVYDIAGIVEPESQVAVWRVQLETNENTPMFETGLFNLTLQDTPVDVHFEEGYIEQWFLIRL